jgi:hypothetical protein
VSFNMACVKVMVEHVVASGLRRLPSSLLIADELGRVLNSSRSFYDHPRTTE